MADTPAIKQPSIPRRLVNLGVLGAVLAAGVLETVSFLFFACPCTPQMVRPEYPIHTPEKTPETPPDAAKSTS